MDGHWHATREHHISVCENLLPQKQVHGLPARGTIRVEARLRLLIINETGEPTHPAESLYTHPWIRGNRGAVLAHRSHPGKNIEQLEVAAAIDLGGSATQRELDACQRYYSGE